MIRRKNLAAAGFALAVGLGLSACASGLDVDARQLVYSDLAGAEQRPLVLDEGRLAAVVFFVTVDCPIANGYSPEIQSIVVDHRGKGFDFYVVHVDPDTDLARAREHAKDFSLDACPILLDPEHRLVRSLGITITPEVAVVRPSGDLAYRGRIDDLYAVIGKKRLEARNRDLRNALAALVAGKPVPVARTVAVGCDIPFID